jgi:hypothetical protein
MMMLKLEQFKKILFGHVVCVIIVVVNSVLVCGIEFFKFIDSMEPRQGNTS